MPSDDKQLDDSPPRLAMEIDEFQRQADRYMSKVIGDKEFTPIQRTNGVYGQARSKAYMLRVKVPSGILAAEQLDALAEIAQGSAQKEMGHITTRQNIQFYGIELEQIPA